MNENFRFSSSWEQFEEAVRKLEDLLKQKKAYWLVGFRRSFDLFIDDITAEEIEENILNIIYDEILYLLYFELVGETIDEEEMRMALTNEENELSEKEIKMTVSCVQNKFELVKDVFYSEQLAIRYNLKKESISLKFSDLKYNIYTHISSEHGKVNFALINMICKKYLQGIKVQIGDLLVEQEKGQEITFICDKEDLDALIDQLEELKKKLTEDDYVGNSRGNE